MQIERRTALEWHCVAVTQYSPCASINILCLGYCRLVYVQGRSVLPLWHCLLFMPFRPTEDQRTNRRTDGPTDRRLDERTACQTDRQTVRQAGRQCCCMCHYSMQADRQTSKQPSRQTESAVLCQYSSQCEPLWNGTLSKFH